MEHVINHNTPPKIYEIRVSGYVNPEDSDILAGMTITASQEESMLRGPLVDQSELNGVINTLVNKRHNILSIINKDINPSK